MPQHVSHRASDAVAQRNESEKLTIYRYHEHNRVSGYAYQRPEDEAPQYCFREWAEDQVLRGKAKYVDVQQ